MKTFTFRVEVCSPELREADKKRIIDIITTNIHEEYCTDNLAVETTFQNSMSGSVFGYTFTPVHITEETVGVDSDGKDEQ